MSQAVSRLPVTGCVTTETRVVSQVIPCEILVDKVAVGQVFLRVLQVLLLLSIRHWYILIYTLLLPEGQMGQVWAPFRSNALSEIGEFGIERYFRVVFEWALRGKLRGRKGNDDDDDEEEGEGGDKCVVLTAPSVVSFSLFFDSLVLGFEG